MLVTPYGLGLGTAAGTDPQTPQLMSVTPFSTNTSTDWSVLTKSALTPTTGNLVVVFAIRSNAAAPNDVTSVTWAGDAVTEIVEAKFSAQGGAHVWAGYIIDGSSEFGDLVVTADAGGAKHRDLIGWLLSFDQLAASPVGASFSYAARSEQAAQSIPITVENARSRLIGFAAAMYSAFNPYTVSSGWTLQSTALTGSGGLSDISAAVADRAATATGLTTLTITGDPTASSPTTDDWCAAGIELLPY